MSEYDCLKTTMFEDILVVNSMSLKCIKEDKGV